MRHVIALVYPTCSFATPLSAVRGRGEPFEGSFKVTARKSRRIRSPDPSLYARRDLALDSRQATATEISARDHRTFGSSYIDRANFYPIVSSFPSEILDIVQQRRLPSLAAQLFIERRESFLPFFIFPFERRDRKGTFRINDRKTFVTISVALNVGVIRRVRAGKHISTCGKWATTFSSHATFLT